MWLIRNSFHGIQVIEHTMYSQTHSHRIVNWFTWYLDRTIHLAVHFDWHYFERQIIPICPWSQSVPIILAKVPSYSIIHPFCMPTNYLLKYDPLNHHQSLSINIVVHMFFPRECVAFLCVCVCVCKWFWSSPSKHLWSVSTGIR